MYPTFITNENILTIEPLNTSNDADITIFDMNGQLIYHKTLSSTTPQTLGTSEWKRGLYIVKIKNGNEIKAVKVIKNRRNSSPSQFFVIRDVPWRQRLFFLAQDVHLVAE